MPKNLQTAQGINYSLRSLYWLAGKNRVSSRRAKVLAYICGLLLRTLPVMAEERRAGITYIPNPPEPDLPRNRHDKRIPTDDESYL